MKPADIISSAFHTLLSNSLRAGITVCIIAFGITALVGILTAIEAMNQKLMESFSTLGANGFVIRHKERSFQFGAQRSRLQVERKQTRRERISQLNKAITPAEAEAFINYYHYPSLAGISVFGGNNHRISYGSRKTAPNVYLFGGDENYLALNGYTVAGGRNFSAAEIERSAPLCLLGYDVALKLFPANPVGSVGKIVRVGQQQYRVAGVLGARGSSFGFSRDNLVVIGYKNLWRLYPGRPVNIGVKTGLPQQVVPAMGEAELVLRAVRRLRPSDESNFVIDRSNSLAEKAMNSLRMIRLAVTLIGLITVVGAAIGLMNILLVAVAERTRELGVMKALGANNKTIVQQLLAEAVLISIMGAAAGIDCGIAAGNLFAYILNTGFIIPWNWIIYAALLCTLVGLLAGIYPAWKAVRLHPIDALRYE